MMISTNQLFNPDYLDMLVADRLKSAIEEMVYVDPDDNMEEHLKATIRYFSTKDDYEAWLKNLEGKIGE